MSNIGGEVDAVVGQHGEVVFQVLAHLEDGSALIQRPELIDDGLSLGAVGGQGHVAALALGGREAQPHELGVDGLGARGLGVYAHLRGCQQAFEQLAACLGCVGQSVAGLPRLVAVQRRGGGGGGGDIALHAGLGGFGPSISLCEEVALDGAGLGRGCCALGACGGLELASDDRAQLQAVADGGEGIHVRVAQGEGVHVECHRHVGDYLCQPSRQAYLLGRALDLGAQGTAQLVGVAEQLLYAAKLLDELGGGLLAHARTAGDVVGSVAHQAEDVYDLARRVYAPLLADGLGTHEVEVALRPRAKHGDVLGDELPVVLVGGEHVGLYATAAGLGGQGAYDIVGLVACHLDDGDVVGLEDLLDVGRGKSDALRGLVALGLVGGIALAAERAAGRVEGHADVRGAELCQHLLKHVDETHHCRRVLAVAVDARILDEPVVGPED